MISDRKTVLCADVWFNFLWNWWIVWKCGRKQRKSSAEPVRRWHSTMPWLGSVFGQITWSLSSSARSAVGMIWLLPTSALLVLMNSFKDCEVTELAQHCTNTLTSRNEGAVAVWSSQQQVLSLFNPQCFSISRGGKIIQKHQQSVKKWAARRQAGGISVT